MHNYFSGEKLVNIFGALEIKKDAKVVVCTYKRMYVIFRTGMAWVLKVNYFETMSLFFYKKTVQFGGKILL